MALQHTHVLAAQQSAHLAIPLESGNVRHKPVAKPYGLRRLKVGEAVRPETAKNAEHRQYSASQQSAGQPPRHETQHTGERKGVAQKGAGGGGSVSARDRGLHGRENQRPESGRCSAEWIETPTGVGYRRRLIVCVAGKKWSLSGSPLMAQEPQRRRNHRRHSQPLTT